MYYINNRIKIELLNKVKSKSFRIGAIVNLIENATNVIDKKQFSTVTISNNNLKHQLRNNHLHSYNQNIRFSTLAIEETSQNSPEPSSNQKIIPFVLPDIGEGIAEVEILKWSISPGDSISQFDNVCQVQSDKATVDITSRYDGIVHSLDGNVGDIINVGSPLFHIIVDKSDGDDGKTLSNTDDKEDRLSIPSSTSTTFPFMDEKGDKGDNKVLASPAVRKLGKENNINLSTVVGTGPNGRVLKCDLLKILHGKKNDEYTPVNKQEEQTYSSLDDEDEVVPIRGYNRLMIKSTTLSLQIPHMVYSDEINVTSLLSLKKSINKQAPNDITTKITMLPFIIKAASLSLKQFPIINSTFNQENSKYELVKKKDHNIGIAMDTKNGLVVPIIKKVQLLSIQEISNELKRLQYLAQENALTENDTNASNCAFSISNIGAVGGTYMSPIIIPPQIGIAAFGKIQRLPRFKDDTSLDVHEVHCMNISIAADHRVVDGATLARFCKCWKEYLEDPSAMILHLK